MTLLFSCMLIIAYLVGSISGARLVSWLFNTEDPIKKGSGNPGATNMYRIAGKKAAILTFLIDTFKALIPVYGCFFLGLSPIQLAVIAIAACLGHIWPIYYQFKGGKGVATAFGAMLPIGYDFALMLIATWIVTAYLSRFSSLASIVTSAMAPIYIFFIKPAYFIPSLFLCFLIILRHASNIHRLFIGKERSIDDNKDKSKTL